MKGMSFCPMLSGCDCMARMTVLSRWIAFTLRFTCKLAHTRPTWSVSSSSFSSASAFISSIALPYKSLNFKYFSCLAPLLARPRPPSPAPLPPPPSSASACFHLHPLPSSLLKTSHSCSTAARLSQHPLSPPPSLSRTATTSARAALPSPPPSLPLRLY